MCVFTVHKHDFDVHTAFYPHVASCSPCVPSLTLNNGPIQFVHYPQKTPNKNIHIMHCFVLLHVPSLTTGPSTNTAVIIAPILVGMVMLLVGITLLVINVILIVKRKRHTPTVQYDKESKVQIYDEVGNYVKSTKDTKVYQELDVNKMDDTNQYATIK